MIPFQASAKDAEPIGNPKAPQGGSYATSIGAEPATLHPIRASDAYAYEIFQFGMASLLRRNPDTLALEPYLAKSIDVSADGKVFTVNLRKGAKFHNGVEVTSEDVKFSYDAIFDDRFDAAFMRPFYDQIKSAEIVDKYTVKFFVKEKYFKNFDVVAMLDVVPKSIYNDPKKKHSKSFVGAGPYKLKRYNKGQRIVLEKVKNWWGSTIPALKGHYNFSEIIFRFARDETVEIEMLKKGRIDSLGLAPDGFIRRTDGDYWDKIINKYQIENKSSGRFDLVSFNLKKDFFKDRKVRLALNHLFNRKLLNQKFYFGKKQRAVGPFFRGSVFTSPKVKPIDYDQEAARKLLREAGWNDSDKDGVLNKKINGRKTDFRFTLIYASKDREKYLTMYKEDLARAGIQLDLKYLEWNSFSKLIDDRNFDALIMSWGAGGENPDPKALWHSDSDRKGGSNYLGYSNPEVDKLIDEARKILDREKRIPIMRKIHELIAHDVPCIFLFNKKYLYYATRKRISIPKETYNYYIGESTWWANDAGK